MKQKWLKIVNPLLLASMLVQIISGVGMAKLQLGWMHEVHEVNGPIIAILFFTHLILNWGWFSALLKNRP